MANNLRVSFINVISNTLIKVSFTDVLSKNIITDNITITSETPGVPDPQVIKIKIVNEVLEITTQPLTILATYSIVFASTDKASFKSLNGNSILLEDGVANRSIFVGPFESTNPIKEYFFNYLRDNVYDVNEGTVLSSHINALSDALSRTLYDIRQARSDNYLSITVQDEPKTRGIGAFDRLNTEGAYEILRVGKTLPDTPSTLTIVSDISSDPVSLLQTNFSESLTVNSVDKEGVFNINSFVMNLSKRFVIKLKSVTFTYSNGHLPYEYDISKFGYQILDAKYDSKFAFKYLQLSDKQIRLNEKILEDSNFSSSSIFQIQISYDYKDTGRTVNSDTVQLTRVAGSGREVLPALRNVFNLKHAPIVNNDDRIGTLGDIEFVDQNVLPVLDTDHPAFKTEIKFRLDFLPSNPGEYSVDYDTGTIYVYGSDLANDGTGATPPLAIYSYRIIFKENIDWVLDETDLVALPNGSAINSTVNITFNYEQVLAAGMDYQANLHVEVLDERINNNLVALNALTVKNAPITNVFRIFNESSGEIYRIVRWNNNKIFFTYTTPPKIEEFRSERISFEDINNEVLFTRNVIDTASPTLKVFKITFNNNNIIAQSQDCIGASFNTSVSFSNQQIFETQLYYDPTISELANLIKLDAAGKYLVDHANGIAYVAVNDGQVSDIGTVSYKRSYVIVSHPHITSVEDIYYRINTLSNKEKRFEYIEFGDGFILPSSFDVADEHSLSDNTNAFYIVLNNKIGSFDNTTFVNAVRNNIQSIRGIYELDDLSNNPSPINFNVSATFTNKSITVGGIEKKEYHTIQYGVDGYFVELNTGLQYLSTNISLDISVLRLSDHQDLWNGTGSIVAGNLIKLIIPNTYSPMVGDSVLVIYEYSINNLSRVIVDYNKGEYYVDYSALTDEIIVSYEYGDNSLDFRESSALNIGENYYATYKTGALRDALFKNFGSLIDIDILNSFDTTFGRERYRDALMAAMQSFAKGPTAVAIENIASIISHLPAEVIESVFENWSLGNSLLTYGQPKISDELLLETAKYNEGILIDQPDQTITIPAISNIKLENGTFEAWVRPEWDGLDNRANITISPTRDGYVVPELEVFVGAMEYHPVYDTDINGKKSFTINAALSVEGIPNKNKDGIYVYYSKDISSDFKRWFIEIIDGYANDGYVADGYKNKKYSLSISTDGKFYDVKSTVNPKPLSSRITSGNNSVIFAVNSIFPDEGITFLADHPHYLLDFAEDSDRNRFSLFKDESGYLNFKIYDKFKNSYTVSTNISNWKHGELHHVAASWKINTKSIRDELHLFIDGFEVPNIIRYGDRIKPYLHEKYRTVNPEEIVGAVDKNLVAGIDLSIAEGSTHVVSSVNFSQYGININDILYIEEPGFNANGYSISAVNGNILTLNTFMPATMTDLKFSVNKLDLNLKTEVDIFANFTVSLIHSFLNGSDLGTTSNFNTVVSSTTNFITSGVIAGDLIRIDDPDFEKHYTILAVNAHSLVLNDEMPLSLTNLSFSIHREEEEIPGLRALLPAYELSKSTDGYHNNILTLRDKGKVNDLVMVRTLGLNHRRVRRKYYVWSNSTNIIKTLLPSPISLNEVNIYKIILDRTFIGPDNSTLISNVFISNNIITDQPTSSVAGRTLSVNISGDNIDFSTPTTVSINGITVGVDGYETTVTETLIFTEQSTQYTTHLYAQVNYVQVDCKPINTSRNSAIIEIKEKYSLTQAENSILYGGDPPIPLIKYSYQIGIGTTLYTDGYTVGEGYIVSDDSNFFSSNVVGNYLIINYPLAAAGYFKIADIANNHKSLILEPGLGPLPLSAFSDGYYSILNTTDYRSGLQNGYFTFEYKHLPGSAYYLDQGSYELDYYTYLGIPFDLKSVDMYIGSDFEGKCQFGGVIDEMQILNTKLTDTRIGETAPITQRTITKEFNSIKQSEVDTSSLVMLRFDDIPPTNEAEVYLSADKYIPQAGEVINDNFTQSICIIEKPLIIDNTGILNTKTEATIEFWVNPLFDAHNDPNYRFYFDAYGAVSETVISVNSTTVKLSGKASEVFDVKLAVNGKSINYFAGGSIGNDNQTLLLHKELPNQNTSVVVNYLPKNAKGDRIAIYKDPGGDINFLIHANSIDYQIKSPVFWSRNTWHRIKASYRINGGFGTDEMHLFIDGYERGDVVLSENLLLNEELMAGSSFYGPNNLQFNINFSDPINTFYVGSDYLGLSQAHCLIDNFRISNISRPLYQPFGEPIDPNYSSNINMVFPITEDLYTTLLLNFDTLLAKNTDFVVLKNVSSGLADFSVKVSDSLDIIDNNSRVKEVLETLINSFKPANTRALIEYL